MSDESRETTTPEERWTRRRVLIERWVELAMTPMGSSFTVEDCPDAYAPGQPSPITNARQEDTAMGLAVYNAILSILAMEIAKTLQKVVAKDAKKLFEIFDETSEVLRMVAVMKVMSEIGTDTVVANMIALRMHFDGFDKCHMDELPINIQIVAGLCGGIFDAKGDMESEGAFVDRAIHDMSLMRISGMGAMINKVSSAPDSATAEKRAAECVEIMKRGVDAMTEALHQIAVDRGELPKDHKVDDPIPDECLIHDNDGKPKPKPPKPEAKVVCDKTEIKDFLNALSSWLPNQPPIDK